MTFIKYILKAVFKNQLIILIILFMVCFCQKLIKLLGLLENANVSMYLIVLCLLLNIPELGKLIIPCSTFLGVLITFYRLHVHNEIIAMYSCAVDKVLLIKSILIFSVIIAGFFSIDLAWLSPCCAYYQNRLLYDIKDSINFNDFWEKKIYSLDVAKNLILFIDSVHDQKLKDIFLLKIHRDKDVSTSIIVTADYGNIKQQSDGLKTIVLENGVCYDLYYKNEVYNNVFITDFAQYEMLVNPVFRKIFKQKKSIDYMSMRQLWYCEQLEAQIELNWRLTLLISIFVMPMTAMFLITNFSNSYLFKFLLGMFLYIFFFVSHIILHYYIIVDETNSILWIWLFNGLYLTIIFLCNMWNTVFMKKLVAIMFKHHSYM
ncbi:LptF/LptG family permease [Candidatus Blochmannia ocreatus (nom. nud.)]|uniref:LptF/LptG family permease n=1 Tax=Candidatus Blochmannia ocreatus (nom. nud.) TaxID=251538 RepID=A0ABY4ST32_9ENTR|nr:LptF/LptG family permease [Candidatus Blochmannia ocreatus]URJ25127.1 LptF/LptG family permease [Candidatus Blochmannia ocreatus]